MRLLRTFGLSLVVFMLLLSSAGAMIESSGELELQIHKAYLAREGVTYTKLLRYALYLAHRMTPDRCVDRQRDLIDIGREHGFDGLESLWLIYQDCAAASNDPAVKEARLENARLLQKKHLFQDEPALQLSERVTRWNSLIERSVRSEALRVVMENVVALPPASSADMSYRTLLSLKSVRADLDALDLRPDQSGALALSEIIRKGTYSTTGMTGGRGTVNWLCLVIQAGLHVDEGSPAEDRILLLSSEMGLSQDQLERLDEFCKSRASSPGLSSWGYDSLDGFSEVLCGNGTREQIEKTGEMVELFNECYGSARGRDLPLAGDGDLVFGSNPDGSISVYDSDGNEIGGFDDVVEYSQYFGEDPEGGTEASNTTGEDSEGGTEASNTTGEDSEGGTETSTTGEDSEEETTGTGTETTGTETTGTETTDGGTIDGGTIDGGTTDTGTTGTSTTSNDTPETPDPGGFDPHNPACRELARLGLDENDSRFWNGIFNRKPGEDPRKVYPRPDDMEEGSGELFCDSIVLTGGTHGAHCQTPVLCADGTVLDENCKCTRPADGRQIPQTGCRNARCAEYSTAVPVDAIQCECQDEHNEPIGDWDREGGGPYPDPVNDPFNEILWNRNIRNSPDL